MKHMPSLIVDMYKTHIVREHVLVKPEHYLGSLIQTEETMWVFENDKMVLKKVKFIPALYKIFDQVLINAAEHKMKDPDMTFINISVRDSGFISITNDGRSIPNQKIKGNRYLAHRIFGECSGLQPLGYSVKLVNIFSKSFYVQTGHQSDGVALKITWKNNMQEVEQPAYLAYDKRDYTKIGFYLDMEKLFAKNKKISSSMMSLFERRAYDIAGLLRVRVTFNSKLITFNNFIDYSKLYVKQDNHIFFDQKEISPRWNVLIGKSEHGFQQISFVNGSVWTKNGGTHVKTVLEQIVQKALQVHSKRLRDPMEVHRKPEKFQSNYILFVSIYLQEAQYKDIAKDELISPTNKLPSLYFMSYQALAFLQKHQLLQNFKEIAKQRQNKKMAVDGNKEMSKYRVIVPNRNLEDAVNAGISSRCTLVIVENEAVKSLVAAGLQSTNRDYFGILVLKEKLPNVRELTNKQVAENEDFQGLAKALGLTIGKKCESLDNLRYSNILIAMDHSIQSSENKGLLLNFFEVNWFPLCKTKGFIRFLVLPMVVCQNSSQKATKYYISVQNMKESSIKNSMKQWSFTTYKGIGNFTTARITEMMLNFKKWVFNLVYKHPGDEQCLKTIFSRKYNQKKKRLLQDYRPTNFINYDFELRQLPIKELVEKELLRKVYFQEQLLIPHCFDGLLLSQRKALHCLFQQKNKEIKVSNLIAMIQKNSNFHFQQEYLYRGITKMGQAFVGRNNLALIKPLGHFGSRYFNGADAALPNHLFTSLPKLTTLLFPEDDFPILQYEQNQTHQCPKYYLPILPLILINGCNSTSITFNSIVYGHRVNDVIEMIKSKLQKTTKPMIPNWERFKGTIELERKDYFYLKGNFQIKGKYLKITQIPVHKSLKEYKIFLEQFLPADNREGILQSIKENHRQDSVEFIIKFQDGKMPPSSELPTFLRLQSQLVQDKILLLDQQGRFKKYSTVSDVLSEFYDVRLKAYERRKQFLICKKIIAIQQIDQKIKFIKQVLSGEFNLGEDEDVWRTKFLRKGYKKYQDFLKKKINFQIHTQLYKYKDYDHLYKINIQEVSEKRLRELKTQKEQLEQSLFLLRRTDEKQMWFKDITNFEEEWRSVAKKRVDLEGNINMKVMRAYKQPSEPSVKKKTKIAQISDFSLDSLQRAQLQRSKTEKIQEQNSDILKKMHKTDSKNEAVFKNGQKMDLKKFGSMISNMQKSNAQFKRKMKNGQNRQYRDLDVDKTEQNKWQADKLKRDKENQEKKYQIVEQYKKRENDKDIKKEAKNKRDALGRHAQQMFRKVEEQKKKKRQEQQQQSLSDRNHLPRPSRQTPEMTVPYEFRNFTVNQVERKHFSVKGLKLDNKEISKIQDAVDKISQAERNKKSAECISLDDD